MPHRSHRRHPVPLHPHKVLLILTLGRVALGTRDRDQVPVLGQLELRFAGFRTLVEFSVQFARAPLVFVGPWLFLDDRKGGEGFGCELGGLALGPFGSI